jgi:putative salt-induced outer membrane protein YdiY
LRIFFLLLFLFTTSLFAVVSIAPVDIGSNPGLSGNVSGALSSKSGNTQKDDYSLGLRAQYDQGTDYLAWGTLTYDYGTSNGIKNEDKTYAHVRYIHALYEGDWCSELFVQMEQDKFKAINTRSLTGAGVRWRFLNSDDWGKGYVGMGGLIEKIDYTHPEINPNEKNTRANSYVAFTKSFEAAIKLSYVGYFQPKLDDAADYVSSQTVELNIPIYKNLGLSLTAKYLYDSLPAIGIEKRDTAYATSLMWEF